jgi:hypothetical protein
MKDAAQPIEQELLAEKATALAHANDRLAAALATLAAAEAALAGATAEDRPALEQRRRELRATAAERLWFLLVQREAIGLYQHEGALREHRVPTDVRLLAGPRLRH